MAEVQALVFLADPAIRNGICDAARKQGRLNRRAEHDLCPRSGSASDFIPQCVQPGIKPRSSSFSFQLPRRYRVVSGPT